MVLLLRASGDAQDLTRNLASACLRKAGPAAAVPLAKALDHADPLVRRQAITHLGNLGSAGAAAAPALGRLVKNDDWDTRFQAAQALWRIDQNSRAVLPVMIEASAKEDQATRQMGWALLVHIKPPAKEALSSYRAALKADTAYVRVQAADAVWHLTRQADEVLPIYRETIANATPLTAPAVRQALYSIKQMGPDAKTLRVPLLDALRQNKDPFLLQALPAILAKLGPDSIPALVDLASSASNPAEQARSRAAFRTLALMGKPGVEPLVQLARHNENAVRANAFGALQLVGPDAKAAMPSLRKALKSERANERTDALAVLARLGPDAREALADLVELARKDKVPGIRRNALAALPHLQPPIDEIRPLLIDALADPDPLTRLTAADWLWHLDPKDARPAKIVIDTLPNPNCTIHGLRMLVHHPDAAAPAFAAVTDLLDGNNVVLRVAAIQTLDHLGVKSEAHQRILLRALDDKDAGVRIAAAVALRRLGVADKAAVDSLTKTLAKAPDYLRPTALFGLADFGPAARDALPDIERQMPPTLFERVRWLEAMAAIDPAVVSKWQSMLENACEQSGSVPAARLLGQRFPKDARYFDFIVAKLQDGESYPNRLLAAMNLAKGGAWGRPAVPALRQALDDPHPNVRLHAALALEKLEPGKHNIVPVLMEALRDKEEFIARVQAADALAALGPAAKAAVPALRIAVRDPEPSVRFAAGEALWTIDPRSALPCVFQGY